jgi:hypothetical protein
MNNQSELFYGSVCVTDLIEQAKKGHSGFTKGNNGKVYGAINIWLNPEPDKFGNIISLQLQSVKEKRDAEGKIYIGNAKRADNQPRPINNNDVSKLDLNDSNIKLRPSGHYSEVASGGTDVAKDDLPF